MHRSACALNSSAPQSRGSTWPVATSRIRFACDRGEAASRRQARKLGHIRDVGSSERQVPQPWQFDAVSIIDRSGQRKAGRMNSAVAAGTSLGLVDRGRRLARRLGRRRPGPCGSSPLPQELGAGRSNGGVGFAGELDHGLRFLSIRCGSSPMTLPGLSWPSGSNASLISRKTCDSSPYCLRRNWVRASPQACDAADCPAGLEHDVVDARRPAARAWPDRRGRKGRETAATAAVPMPAQASSVQVTFCC